MWFHGYHQRLRKPRDGCSCGFEVEFLCMPSWARLLWLLLTQNFVHFPKILAVLVVQTICHIFQIELMLWSLRMPMIHCNSIKSIAIISRSLYFMLIPGSTRYKLYWFPLLQTSASFLIVRLYLFVKAGSLWISDKFKRGLHNISYFLWGICLSQVLRFSLLCVWMRWGKMYKLTVFSVKQWKHSNIQANGKHCTVNSHISTS